MKKIKTKAVDALTKKKYLVLEKKTFLEALNNPIINEELKLKVLHGACKYDRVDVVEKISENELTLLNVADEDGETAIFHAVKSGSYECVHFLLKNKINLNHINNSGRSVLSYAISYNNFNIVDKLLKKKEINEQVLKQAIGFVINTKNSEALAILADYDVINLKEFAGDINFTDKKQYSPLHYAAKRGFTNAVSKLLYAGSKLVFRNAKETPIGLSVSYGQLDALCVLLRSGCLPFINEKLLSFKWMVVVKRDTLPHSESMSGYDIRELLEYLKLLKANENFDKKVYIICQNYHDHLELLDFFLLKQVVSVIFINCSLKHIPVFENVESLCLNGCVVENYGNLSCFSSLRTLSICNGDLIRIPEPIQELQKLDYLDLSYNKKLTTLPQWIMGINTLRFLSIHENNITELPDLMPSMLEVFYIHNNSIQRLSPLLAQLDCLSYISLHGNPLLFPELSIAKSKTRALLQYLHAFLSDTVPNDVVKVSLVGQERAGKTTLVSSLNSPTGVCEYTEKITKTDGLEISVVNIENVRLRMFDLAGDIDFIETHSMFISEGTLLSCGI